MTSQPSTLPAEALRKAHLRAYNGGTHKADVQLVGSMPTLLADVRVASDIQAADCIVDRECTVLFFDATNPADAVIIAVQGALPTPGSGMAQHSNEYHTPDMALASELATHAGIASAHHARYTDAEVNAIVATHAAIAAAHHAKYLDAEAVAAAKTVKLDDFATPDDNTDLNASTARHGLLPKLPNDVTKFLNGLGAWTAPPGGGGAENPFGAALVPGDLAIVTEEMELIATHAGTATEIDFRVSTAPDGAAINFVVYHYNAAGDEQNSQACSIPDGDNYPQDKVSISWTVVARDYFKIIIGQVGTIDTGKNLQWQVLP